MNAVKSLRFTIDDARDWLIKTIGVNYKGPLNLDCLSENDLQIFILLCEDFNEDMNQFQMDRFFGMLLFCGENATFPPINPHETYLKLDKVIQIYVRYARCKVRAIQCREKGFIGRAEMFEKFCEEDYRSLPKWAKW